MILWAEKLPAIFNYFDFFQSSAVVSVVLSTMLLGAYPHLVSILIIKMDAFVILTCCL